MWRRQSSPAKQGNKGAVTDGQAVRGLLRELREEAVNLQGLADEAVAAATAKKRGSQAAAAVQRLKDLRDRNAAEVNDRLNELRETVRSDPGTRENYGETETRIQNAWDTAYGTLLALDEDRIETYVAFSEAIDPIILETAYVTIPQRVSDNLRSYRIGAALHFPSEVADEIPNTSHQAAIFDWMYRHGGAVPGVFDKTRMVIYKASRSGGIQALTLGAILGVGVGLALLPLARGPLGLTDNLIPNVESGWRLSAAFVMALAGAVAHLFVDQMKDLKRSLVEGEPSATMGNWVLWLHVRYQSILLTLVLVFIASMIVAWHVDTAPVTMLAAGYSADSIIDLALPKVTSLMTKRTEVITKAMSTP